MAVQKGAGITDQHYAGFSGAFRFFNARLFAGQLPEPMFTLQRKPRMRAMYDPKAFCGRRETDTHVDEIALNPVCFVGRTDKQILSSVVHEQVHQWQKHFGKQRRSGYHDREWADKMESVGLMPSHTGAEGGKRTGQRMTHYIIPGGAFDVAADELLAGGWTVEWEDKRGSRSLSSSVVALTATGIPIVMLPGAAGGGRPTIVGTDATPEPDENPSGEPWRPEELPAWLRDCAAAAGEPEPDAGQGGGELSTVWYQGRPLQVRAAPAPTTVESKSGMRVKYRCPKCSMALWGKAGLRVLCMEDSVALTAV